MMYQSWYDRCIMEKHLLTTEMWHETNTVILVGCKMNWLSTIRISEQHLVRIWQKYVAVIFKNHENTQKKHLTKYQKLNTNYWSFLKGALFCTCVVKIVFKMKIYLVNLLLNCSFVYWKIGPILSSKIELVNPQEFDIIYILSYHWSCSNIGYQYFQLQVNYWFSSQLCPKI